MENCNDTIIMPIDLSGRYVHRLVYKLQNLDSSIHFLIKDRNINAKSLIGMFSAQIKKGNKIQVICYHEDSDKAHNDLKTIHKILAELAVMDDES